MVQILPLCIRVSNIGVLNGPKTSWAAIYITCFSELWPCDDKGLSVKLTILTYT